MSRLIHFPSDAINFDARDPRLDEFELYKSAKKTLHEIDYSIWASWAVIAFLAGGFGWFLYQCLHVVVTKWQMLMDLR